MSRSGGAAEDFQKTNDQMLHYDNEPTGPAPTAENPAGVSGGSAPAGSMPGSGDPDHGGDVSGVFSNPEMFKDTFSDLSSAFTKALHAIEDEGGSGIGSVGKALGKRLLEMRDEIDGWRAGKGLPGAAKGEQASEVERVGEGGLYKD